jgi:hypothetical protein
MYLRVYLLLLGAAACGTRSRGSEALSPQQAVLRSTDSAAGTVAEQVLTGVLRRLAVSEEAHYADFSRYTNALDRLSFDVPAQVRLTLASPDPQSWFAVARHADWPGRSCVIWVGPIPDRLLPRTENLGHRGVEGAIVCDD